MSPRSDNYLSLCLEQATKSPMHYRHGCVIVRGGKVIGRGYNDYRAGLHNGLLKSGVLPSSKLDIPAIAELKQRSKTKSKSQMSPKPKLKFQDLQSSEAPTTFTQPETQSDKATHDNAPLTLHSEMMAIQSALSLSSVVRSTQKSARAAKWLQKPCSKASRASKTVRQRNLKAYVQAIWAEAEAAADRFGSGKFRLQESGFEAITSQPGQQGENGQPQQRQG